MQLSDAWQLIEALSVNDANHKLREGWTLVSVVATTHPSGEIHPCYILAKSKASQAVQPQEAQ